MILAAQNSSDRDAKRLISLPLNSIKQSYQSLYVGELFKYRKIEDFFLTIEGYSQWLANQWLTSSRGGKIDEPSAVSEFGLSRKW